MSLLIYIRYRPREYDSEDGPWDPITGGASAIIGTLTSLSMGIADLPVEVLKSLIPRSSDGSKADDGTLPSPFLACWNYIADRIFLLAEGESKSMNASKTTLEPARSQSVDSTKKSEPSSPSAEVSRQLSPASEAAMSPISSRTQAQNSITSAMSSVMSQTTEKPSSRSASPNRANSPKRYASDPHVNLDTALGAGKAASRIVGVGLKSPMDFTLSLARGFHNAPKLYGDQSVRQPDKVTNFQSGLKVAGKVSLPITLPVMQSLQTLGVRLWRLRRDFRSRHSTSRGCKERRRRRICQRGRQGFWRISSEAECW